MRGQNHSPWSLLKHGFKNHQTREPAWERVALKRGRGLKGNTTEVALERAGITCNKNGIPFDDEKLTVTSGIRVGTAAGTTRGFGMAGFEEVGRLMLEVFNSLKTNPAGDAATEASIYVRVKVLTARFPLYA